MPHFQMKFCLWTIDLTTKFGFLEKFCIFTFMDNSNNYQGLLESLWTVYSEGKSQSCLKLRNFQNPFSFNKDKSVGL